MWMLFCMMLIAYAEENNGDDDTYMVITMTRTMTMLLPVALVATLHQCKKLVFSRRSRQKLRN